MSSIAPLDTVSDDLDTVAKFLRLVAREGVSGEQFRRPIDDLTARQNLAAYLKAGCPAIPARKPRPPKVIARPPRLVFLKQVSLPAMPAKKTSECLTGRIYGYRDPEIDRSLPKTQRASDAGAACIYQLGVNQTFADMFRAVLKLGVDAPLDEIARLLKERKHMLTLQQLEHLVGRQEEGEDMGLRTDGWANLAPVENADGSVSVAYVYRYDGRWYRYVYDLGRDYVWFTDGRLVLSNSEPSNL